MDKRKILSMLAREMAKDANMAKALADDDDGISAISQADRDEIERIAVDAVSKAIANVDPDEDHEDSSTYDEIQESFNTEMDVLPAFDDLYDAEGNPVEVDSLSKAVFEEIGAAVQLGRGETLRLAKAVGDNNAEMRRELDEIKMMIAGIAVHMGLAKGLSGEGDDNSGGRRESLTLLEAGGQTRLFDWSGTSRPSSVARGDNAYDPALLDVPPDEIDARLAKALGNGEQVMSPAAVRAMYNTLQNNIGAEDHVIARILAPIDEVTARALTARNGGGR